MIVGVAVDWCSIAGLEVEDVIGNTVAGRWTGHPNENAGVEVGAHTMEVVHLAESLKKE